MSPRGIYGLLAERYLNPKAQSLVARMEIGVMDQFRSKINLEFNKLAPSERKIANEVWEYRADYIKWPVKARLLWPGCVRTKYHRLPDRIKEEARSRGVQVDSRSNGPAVMSFLLAGGERPRRSNRQGWHIDHIYDGKFPWPTRNRSLHAVKDGRHFTRAAGLVAIHPVAEALKDEYSHFAWLLRREARRRFGYDPDGIFSERIDEHGFGKQGNMKIPRGTTY
jgi:hypothetical protein